MNSNFFSSSLRPHYIAKQRIHVEKKPPHFSLLTKMQEQNSITAMYHTRDMPRNGMLSLNDTTGFSSFSGNLGPSSVATMNGSLLPPAQILNASSTFLDRETLNQNFYERRLQALNEDLVQAKEQYNSLWYVSHIFSIFVNLIF